MFRITRDPKQSSTHTHTRTHHGQICCHNTDYVHVNGHDRTITVILAKHCIKLPDDGECLSRQCSTHSASLDSAVHTRTMGKYASITPTTSMSTDTIEFRQNYRTISRPQFHLSLLGSRFVADIQAPGGESGYV